MFKNKVITQKGGKSDKPDKSKFFYFWTNIRPIQWDLNYRLSGIQMVVNII